MIILTIFNKYVEDFRKNRKFYLNTSSFIFWKSTDINFNICIDLGHKNNHNQFMVIWDNIHNLICVYESIKDEFRYFYVYIQENSFQIIEIHNALFKSVSDFNKHNKREFSHLLLIQSWQYSVINVIKVNQIKRNFKSVDYWEEKLLFLHFMTLLHAQNPIWIFLRAVARTFFPHSQLSTSIDTHSLLLSYFSSTSHSNLYRHHTSHFIYLLCLSSFQPPSAFYFALHE